MGMGPPGQQAYPPPPFRGPGMLLPAYKGWTLRKAPDSNSWTRVRKTEFSVSEKDLAVKAKLNRGLTAEDVYDALPLNSQRDQIDRLVDEENETSPWVDWKLARISTLRRTNGFGRVLETTQIRVILKKVLRSSPKPPVQQQLRDTNFPGEVVDLFEPPAPQIVPLQNLPPPPLGQPSGREHGVPSGIMDVTGMMPNPQKRGGKRPGKRMENFGGNFGGNMGDNFNDDMNGMGRSRSPSLKSKKSLEKIEKDVKTIKRNIEKMNISSSDSYESDDSFVDVRDGRRGRKQHRHKIPPPPIGKYAYRRSKSPHPNRRHSSLSSEAVDWSSSSSRYTDATSIGSARYLNRYIDRSRSRSRSRGIIRDHRKPPSYPLLDAQDKQTVINIMTTDRPQGQQYRRRYSDVGPSHAPLALPLAPEVGEFDDQALWPPHYMDTGNRRSIYPIGMRRASYQSDGMRRASYQSDGMMRGVNPYRQRRFDLERSVVDLSIEESDARRRADDAHKRADDAQRRAEDLERRAEGTRRKTEDLERRAEDTQRRTEELERRAEDTQRRVEDWRRIEDSYRTRRTSENISPQFRRLSSRSISPRDSRFSTYPRGGW